jgi:hypothetical protein
MHTTITDHINFIKDLIEKFSRKTFISVVLKQNEHSQFKEGDWILSDLNISIGYDQKRSYLQVGSLALGYELIVT